MNKIQKHFELNFWKDEMVSKIQIKNGKRCRVEKLTEYYTIKELKDYILTYNVSDKTYGIHTYDKSSERFIVVSFKSQKDVIEYLNIVIKNKSIEDENFKNLPIGNTFVFGLVTLKVVKATKELSCKKCWVGTYIPERCGSDIIPYCIGKKRKDKKDVIFVEVEDESME